MHLRNPEFPVRVVASRFLLLGALALTLVFVFSGTASAQTTDVFRVTYFDNNGAVSPTTGPAPDAFIHILNPQNGAFCADIYVWRFDQELSECCSCPITANGLLTLRVSALTSNPGDNSSPLTSGSIDIISDSATTTCVDDDVTVGVAATAPTPTPDLRSWATHVNINTATGGFDVTETETLDTPLSTAEESSAASLCGFLRGNGSGAGRCDLACSGTGTDAKAVRK